MGLTLNVALGVLVFIAGASAQVDLIPDVINGNYFIISRTNPDLMLSARDDGSEGSWQYLGNVTAEVYSSSLPDNLLRTLIWRSEKMPFYESQGPNILRQFNTHGAFSFNTVEIELPRPGSFPVRHYWRGVGVDQHVMLNSLPQFDWDGLGNNRCLQMNGAQQIVTFEQCDNTNWDQMWKFQRYSSNQ